MAEIKDILLQWDLSPHYRFIQPNAVTVTGVDLGDGPSVLMHFTTNVLRVVSEQFSAEVEPSGSVKQVGPPTFKQHSAKLLEVTAKVRVAEIGALIPLLLRSFDQFPEEAKKAVRDALKTIPAA